ncbi:MAG: formyltetrahydrofolate deformylase [Acidobacteria bacterium]|nr:MAG: formyltetrahydrofolate deformylase [Acidobacteriota bacterium]
MKNSAILLISCPDRKGEVAAIADFVYRHNGNILHADEHGDEESGLFLMRVEFDPKDFDIPLEDFGKYFSPVAEAFAMTWRLAHSSHRPRMIIFVSKFDHCLVDLLYRHQSGELACEIPLIISNHPDNQAAADFYKIAYAVVPFTKENKQAAEKQIHSLIDEHKPDFMVLARYMQILSNEFVNRYPQRIINMRGVKLIGATSHYVTEILDDGPIIEQDVVRVSHRDTVEDLVRKGRDLEKVVLSRAVRSHVENRVLVYGNKTVVF